MARFTITTSEGTRSGVLSAMRRSNAQPASDRDVMNLSRVIRRTATPGLTIEMVAPESPNREMWAGFGCPVTS